VQSSGVGRAERGPCCLLGARYRGKGVCGLIANYSDRLPSSVSGWRPPSLPIRLVFLNGMSRRQGPFGRPPSLGIPGGGPTCGGDARGDPLRKRLWRRGIELICFDKKDRVRPATLDRRTHHRLAGKLPARGSAFRPLAHDLPCALSYRWLNHLLTEGCAIACSTYQIHQNSRRRLRLQG